MAKKTKVSFFTKLLIVSAIFLGAVLSYSYIIWNSIQPQLWVVEKIYTWIFSSADTISWENKELHYWFDLNSSINIKQENISIFDGKLDIKNADFFANKTWLKQKISTDSFDLKISKNWETYNHKISDLDIISHSENIYITASQDLWKLFEYITNWKYSEYSSVFKNIFKINQKWSYAHIDNSQPIKKSLQGLDEHHLVNKLLTSLVTSNPSKFFEQNKLWNLLKQSLYNDKWIEYFFIENAKISDDKKKFFIINKEICTQVSPFIEHINFSASWSTQDENYSQDNCERSIKNINPFIALASQIYKFWDIENWNYDFVISQGTQIDMRLTYTNHILQDWNIYIQNPEQSVKLSILWNKFWIKESQFNINYKKDKSVIVWDIVNGTWNVSIKIDNKNQQVNGNIVFQKYLLIDMDVKWKGELDSWSMRFMTSGDYKAWKIDYTVIKDKETINALNIKYADRNYNIDYISPVFNLNSLYATDKFIMGFSEKNIDKTIKKEIKYVYDQWIIKWYYRIDNFEGNLDWEILSENSFQLNLWINKDNQNLKILLEAQEKSINEIVYKSEWKTQDEILFSLEAEKIQHEEKTNINAEIEIPNEKIIIDFVSEFSTNTTKRTYEIPNNIEQINIDLNQIIILPNMHHILNIWWEKLTFLWATLSTIAGANSYLSLQWNSREEKNKKISQDIDIINQAILQAVNQEEFDMRLLIDEVDWTKNDTQIRFGWDKISHWTQYVVGSINYELLALDKNILESDDIKYLVGILNLGEIKKYQILWYLHEIWRKQRVITQWNYIPREFERYDFKIIIPEENNESKKQTSIQIELEKPHHLRIWDITNLWRILDIIDKKLFIENAVNPDISKVYLLWNDSPTLFIYKNKVLEEWEIITKK